MSSPSSWLEDVAVPTLLLDEARVKRNIKRMRERAERAGVTFRPHFKTHQSAAIGDWFRMQGTTAITVSSVAMAAYFIEYGWRDVTIAFPVNLRELDTLNRLAAAAKLGLLLDSPAVAARLVSRLTHPVNIWIEIDTGYSRSGILWSDDDGLATLAAELEAAPQLELEGVLCHAGNTYGARSTAAVHAIYHESVARLDAARASLMDATGRDDLRISVGDTPAASMLDDFGPVDEVRPGNFVFYDLTQQAIGACREADIAVAVACPVVGIYPKRSEFVIYGGAVHLAKESLQVNTQTLSFGALAPLDAGGWGPSYPDTYLRSLSQEHGIARVAPAAWEDVVRELQVGDLVAVLPIHSCLTANLLKRYLTLDGQVLDMAPIPR